MQAAARALDKRERERKQALREEREHIRVFALESTIFPSEEEAEYIDEGRHLLELPTAAGVTVDRYDARLLLQDKADLDAATGASTVPDKLPSAAELEAEQAERELGPLLHYERYRDVDPTVPRPDALSDSSDDEPDIQERIRRAEKYHETANEGIASASGEYARVPFSYGARSPRNARSDPDESLVQEPQSTHILEIVDQICAYVGEHGCEALGILVRERGHRVPFDVIFKQSGAFHDFFTFRLLEALVKSTSELGEREKELEKFGLRTHHAAAKLEARLFEKERQAEAEQTSTGTPAAWQNQESGENEEGSDDDEGVYTEERASAEEAGVPADSPVTRPAGGAQTKSGDDEPARNEPPSTSTRSETDTDDLSSLRATMPFDMQDAMQSLLRVLRDQGHAAADATVKRNLVDPAFAFLHPWSAFNRVYEAELGKQVADTIGSEVPDDGEQVAPMQDETGGAGEVDDLAEALRRKKAELLKRLAAQDD